MITSLKKESHINGINGFFFFFYTQHFGTELVLQNKFSEGFRGRGHHVNAVVGSC